MDNLDHLVIEAKTQNTLREDLICSETGFILSCAFESKGCYVTKNDDEWSIALIGFSHAIDTYELVKGHFHPYAKTVIKNALTDYYRKDRQSKREALTDPSCFENPSLEDPAGKELYLSLLSAEPLDYQSEILLLEQAISAYGFTFWDLVNSGTRQTKTRELTKKAITYLQKNPHLLLSIRTSHCLPLKEIYKNTGVSKKFLEHNRRYIIAVLEIITGDYPLLIEYVKDFLPDKPKQSGKEEK